MEYATAYIFQYFRRPNEQNNIRLSGILAIFATIHNQDILSKGSGGIEYFSQIFYIRHFTECRNISKNKNKTSTEENFNFPGKLYFRKLIVFGPQHPNC